jgi:hypothetical protein
VTGLSVASDWITTEFEFQFGRLPSSRNQVSRRGTGAWLGVPVQEQLEGVATELVAVPDRAPVSLYTVRRGLGHGSEEMVKRVYAYLGTARRSWSTASSSTWRR